MIDGKYRIEADTPLGRKSGTLELRTKGDIAYADIDAPVLGRKSAQGHASGDTFAMEGSARIGLLGRIDYTVKGQVLGDNLRLDIQSNKGEFTFEGARISQ